MANDMQAYTCLTSAGAVWRLLERHEALLDLFVAMRLAELVRWYGSAVRQCDNAACTGHAPHDQARRSDGEGGSWEMPREQTGT